MINYQADDYKNRDNYFKIKYINMIIKDKNIDSREFSRLICNNDELFY